ncbi:MAG: 4-(cytidine 5'-diphospho)-2-C-methyl-D-erythritol kinase [Eubacteriales bacterium]|jgi:4-diphosphocytidyl-2-C-methyl-D-erythritol kinase|nr:4-(cytidine 5'-diphospho)-2-C-methyl-D-erythritol kinase [Eubacteriales bacterium]
MDRTTKRAYAKLNLTLGVLYKRADGYHALDSIMQTIDLHDTVTIERARDILVTGTGMVLPYDNTLRRAAEQYRALTGRGAHIRVVKRIPAEAGLGGGSADAAAALNGLQELYGEVDEKTLLEIGAKVGADVPFCLRGGLQRAEGIGDVLTPLRGMKLHLLVAKPAAGVSTRKLFSLLKLPRVMPQTASALKALSDGDLDALCPLFFNALEEPAIALVPEIGRIKADMLALGAKAACMSGSGSAVFGVFADKAAAEAARPQLDGVAFARVCESI